MPKVTFVLQRQSSVAARDLQRLKYLAPGPSPRKFADPDLIGLIPQSFHFT